MVISSLLISEKSEQLLSKFESRLSQLLPENPTGLENEVVRAARYALLSGGKRLRPLLLLSVVTACGIKLEAAIDIACAIEMIHTYSLIHDDLPCMDNDDLRRGVPTVHIQFSESLAVLAGDLLLTKPYEIIAGAALSDAQKVALFAAFGAAAGSNGLVGGQTIDMAITGKSSNQLTLQEIALKKTGALMALSLECGAILATLPDSTSKVLREIGFSIGYIFQIVDDILDYTGTTKSLGKPAFSDELNGKFTFVNLYGVSGALKLSETLLTELKTKIGLLPFDSGDLLLLAEKIISRKK